MNAGFQTVESVFLASTGVVIMERDGKRLDLVPLADVKAFLERAGVGTETIDKALLNADAELIMARS